MSGPPTARVAVGVEKVAKRFGATVALDAVTLDVREGELFGVIGPDGAGKTTLLRILSTLMVPDSGRATVLGRDVLREFRALRREIGYMPGRFSLYSDLSVEENVRFFASVFGTTLEREYDRIAPIYTQLERFRDRRAGALSGGMKQKLALCCALVHRPRILFLDEPTTGVDAVSRREFWELLVRLVASGLTAVVSTPYMDEASRCERVALMQGGHLLAVDTPGAIVRSFDRPLVAVRATDRYGALLAIRGYQNTRTVVPFGETLHYTDLRDGVDAGTIARELADFLHGRGMAGASTAVIAPTVEDVFMARAAAPAA